MLRLASILLVPALVSATSFEYYRSVACDAQSPDFLIERHDSLLAMSSDQMCHQTPAGTMAMKMVDGVESNCIILAYDDYGCSSLVGSVPASGKCVGATKAKIGSWQASCNATGSSSVASIGTTFAPGELKRRGKVRLPVLRDETTLTIDKTACSTTTDNIASASSTVSETSWATSASDDVGPTVTSSPSVGVALSPASASGTDIVYDLNFNATDAAVSPSATAVASNETNTTYASPSMTTSPRPTVTYSANTSANGTATLYLGAAVSNRLGNDRVSLTILTGLAAIMSIMIVM